jgi:methionyl-tRNA formyltransferase
MEMYKRVLIVTDNINLAREFNRIIEAKKYTATEFNFSTSPFSDIDLFREGINKPVETVDFRDAQTIERLRALYDLILSIHCKQIFPPDLVNHVKCINIHPGYNPYNRGWYPQVFSIINNLPIGATIHEIDELLDHGLIIDRSLVPKYAYDTSGSLYERVVEEEIKLLEKNLDAIINNTYTTIQPESLGNVFLKKDFNKLKEIDLNEQLTAGEFINKLRALTHGNFKNAYFLDPETGKKIFISLNLEVNE